MTNETYDAIIIGSGAGGASVAYNLIQAGKRVLVLEKGDFLPHDNSTLNVKTVFKEGKFKNHDQWVDNHNRIFVPEEFSNVGGKTKWYGAALLRFSPHEFEADDEFKCLAWPISYEDMESYYQQAEEILKVQTFVNYEKLNAQTWRPETIKMKNLQTKKVSVLTTNNRKIDQKLPCI